VAGLDVDRSVGISL